MSEQVEVGAVDAAAAAEPKEHPLYLNDLLHLTDDEMSGKTPYRVRLTFSWGNDDESDPIERYRRDPEDALKHLLFYRPRNEYSVGDRVIGMTKIVGTQWLLTRIVEITDVQVLPEGGKKYSSRDIEKYRGFFGRVILNFRNQQGNQTEVRPAFKVVPRTEVREIRSTGFGDDGFPGYADVTVSWHKLAEIFDRGYESWRTALSNMKGIYLIVDKSNGAAYVGKADGAEGAIWNRWASYAKTRHGGNVELRKLEDEHMEQNFQWSILEVMDWKTEDAYVNARESWWKQALSTRGEGGYNRN